MGRRFSRIRDAARLSQAVDNYQNWEASSATRPRNVGGGTARGPQDTVFIDPFGRDLGTGTFASARVSVEARTQMGAAVGLRVLTTLPVESSGSRVAGFSPAKVVLKIRSGNGTATVSKITGLQYLKYDGASYSHPFGRATANDLEYDTFGEIRAALLAPGGTRNVSYKPEIFRQI